MLVRNLSTRSISKLAATFAAAFAIAGPCAAQTAAPSPRQLVEMNDITNVSTSPDGRTAVFRVDGASIEANAYMTTWYALDIDGPSAPRRLATGGSPIREADGLLVSALPIWSPDSKWIYFRALHGAEIQIWRASIVGDRVEQLTADPANIRSFTLAGGGTALIYSVGASRTEIAAAEQREYDSGILIDGSAPVGQGLFRSGFVDGRLATQRYSGEWMAREGLLADRSPDQKALDLPTRTIREATADEVAALEQVGDGVVRDTQSDAVALVQGEGGNRHLQAQTGGHVVQCRDRWCSADILTGFAWRPGRNELIFSARDRSWGYGQRLMAWKPEESVREILVTDGLMSGDRSGVRSTCAVSVQYAVCVDARPAVPPTLQRIDLDTGERRFLFDPNPSLVENPDVEPFEWRGASGRRFSGYLFRPRGLAAGERAPLFITYYACVGYLRGGLGDEWPLAALADAGIAALCVNQAARDPSIRDKNIAYEMAQEGVQGAIDELDRQGVVDSRRVGMGGLSFGTEVVSWVAANTDLLAAASTTSGLLTPTYYWFHSLQPDFQRRLKTTWGLDAPDASSEAWSRGSPVYQVERIRTPILMQMPEQEYLGVIEYYARLINAGCPAELYVFPNEPHVKQQPRHNLAAYERNLDWFRFWLQGYIDLDPLKVEQYQRWLNLRRSTEGQER